MEGRKPRGGAFGEQLTGGRGQNLSPKMMRVRFSLIFCNIILSMSKPNIKFVYSGEIRSNVVEAQRGPLMLNNLLDSYLRPKYEQIRLKESQSNPHLPTQSQPQSQITAQPAFPFGSFFEQPRLNQSQPNPQPPQSQPQLQPQPQSQPQSQMQSQSQSNAQPAFPFASFFEQPRANESQTNSQPPHQPQSQSQAQPQSQPQSQAQSNVQPAFLFANFFEQPRLSQSQPNPQPPSQPQPQSQSQPNRHSVFPFNSFFEQPQRSNESQPRLNESQPRLNDSQPNSQTNLPAVSTMDINSKTASLARSKSADFLKMILTGESNEVEEQPEQNQNQNLLVPTINIEDINESEFIKPPPKKKKTPMIGEGDQIVLKAPSFKFQPRQDGLAVRGGKNEFQKAEKAEKYFYKGIPEKTENDFVGCFGCMQPKVQAFTATTNKKK